MDEMRARERKLEDQRHNLELSLSDAQQEIKALKVNLNGSEGRIGEMHATIVRLETSKKDVESKLASVCGLLQQFRCRSTYIYFFSLPPLFKSATLYPISSPFKKVQLKTTLSTG